MNESRLSGSTVRRSLLAVITAAVCTTAMAQKVQDRAVQIDRGDRAMAAAIAHAKSTLDSFLELKAHPPKGASDFKLKVRFSDPNGSEYMWVIPFAQTSTGFVGTLADRPAYVTNVSDGQQVRFTRQDIADWGYVLDGRQKGSFTVCVVFRHMPKAEVDAYRKAYGFDC